MLIIKNIQNNTVYIMQELHLLCKKQRFTKHTNGKTSNKLTLKIELIIFTMTLILKILMQGCYKLTKIVQKHWYLQHWVYHKEKN